MNAVDMDRRAAAGMAEILAMISADEHSKPTPCPGWSVEDLIAHVLAGNIKYAEIAMGREWSPGVPAIVVGKDPLDAYRTTVESMLTAWAEPGALDREIGLPVGRGRAEAALYIHLGETLVHGWDLAVSTGRSAIFDTDVVEASLGQFRSWLPATRSGQAPFSDATSIPDDADAIDRLAAYLGRDVSFRRH